MRLVTTHDNRNYLRVVLIMNGSSVFDAAIADEDGLNVRAANRLEWEQVGLAGLSDY